MKNVIISALSAYVFYEFCEVKHFMIPILAFLLILVTCAGIDEEIYDFQESVKRGQRLNNKINRMKGVKF